MQYPQLAEELKQLLEQDQAEKRAVGRAYFEGRQVDLNIRRVKLAASTGQRTKRVLEILETISEPSISNIGVDGAQAISVLAVHDSLDVQRRVLKAFVTLYEYNRKDAYYQAIPPMTDLVLILERKPQRFGTQWMFDDNKQPFLPVVEDFDHVNERRAEYDIEPLRWPKSLAIPESKQPWLKKPLSELVMRIPIEKEYKANLE